MLQLHIAVANLCAVIRLYLKGQKIRMPVQLPEKRILIKYIQLHTAESFLETRTRNTQQKNKFLLFQQKH
jgi:hypothetical protein